MMATARFDMRLDAELKAKAEKASALLGMKSLTDYVVKLMEENASRVIAEHESIVVKSDIFDRFMLACDRSSKPNKALKDAAEFTKDQEIR
jgi:uncharacterized protein (DUF1778 family)